MNGILLLDKPQGFTSHDVVAKLRGILRERRIGHSGTLDPLATGLLVVFVGRATRAVQFAEGDGKAYLAGLRLGVTTDTQDITGRVLRLCGDAVSEEALRAALQAFTGDIVQLPPMYSAIKVGGKKLYEIARSGGEVERRPRPIHIEELSLLGRQGEDCTLRVRCSKGTYIRTLCHDIGQKLGVGGCMSSLRRTAAGRFRVQDAVTLERVQEEADRGRAQALLLPVDSLFSQFPALTVDGEGEKRCRNGNAAPVRAADGNYRVYAPGGGFLLLGRVRDGVLSTVKSFFET